MDVKILHVVSILDGLCFSMFMAAWTPYMTSLGASSFFMGVLASAIALIALIWNPIAGSFSDLFGRKRSLMQWLVVCAIGNGLMVLSSSLIVITISRLICAFGTQNMPLIKALVDDNIPSSEEKLKTLHRLGALGGITFITGALASALLNNLSNGTTVVFIAIATMNCVNIVLVSFLKNDTPRTDKKKDKEDNEIKVSGLDHIISAFNNLRQVNWPKYWDVFIIKIISDIALNLFFYNNGLILTKQYGVQGSSFGYIMAGLGVIGIIMNLLLGLLKNKFYSDDISGFKRLLHANLAMVVCFVLAGLAPTLPLYILSLCPIPFSRILVDSTMTELLLSRASQQEKGKVLGAFESTLPFGGLIAPLVSGIIASYWNESMILLLGTIPVGFGTVLCYYNNVKSLSVKKD